MIFLAPLILLSVLYLGYRINRLEARLSRDEWDFATRLDGLAARTPDEELARLEAEAHEEHIDHGMRIPGCRFCDEEGRARDRKVVHNA